MAESTAGTLGAISPAAHLAEVFAAATVTGARGVQLREVPFLTQIGIRVVPGTDAAAQVEARLGAALPTRCGQVTTAQPGTGAGVTVLWLSPDEFLAVGEQTPAEQTPAELTGGLVDALAGQPGSAIDLSANRTTFELSGPSARAVLEKGCPLDLHPRAFATGAAYVTQLGPVPVIMWKTGDDTFRLLPRSSFADFLGRWLVDAMAEFAAPELSPGS